MADLIPHKMKEFLRIYEKTQQVDSHFFKNWVCS